MLPAIRILTFMREQVRSIMCLRKTVCRSELQCSEDKRVLTADEPTRVGFRCLQMQSPSTKIAKRQFRSTRIGSEFWPLRNPGTRVTTVITSANVGSGNPDTGSRQTQERERERGGHTAILVDKAGSGYPKWPGPTAVQIDRCFHNNADEHEVPFSPLPHVHARYIKP